MAMDDQLKPAVADAAVAAGIRIAYFSGTADPRSLLRLIIAY